MSDFQQSVSYTWPQGCPGAPASANPIRTAIAPDGGFIAGAGGLTIAHFVWRNEDGLSLSNTGTGIPAGFLYRTQQGLTTQYLQSSTMALPQGFMASIAEGGDFWAIASTAASTGQAVYASTADGSLQTAPAGNAPQGTVATGWTVARGGNAGEPIIISGPMHPIAT